MARRPPSRASIVAVLVAASCVSSFAGAISPGGIGVTHTGGTHAVEVPVATFAGEADGLELHVDASASYDPYGRPLYYNWFWGDGTGGAGGPLNNHSYKKNGCNGGPLCQVRLQVTAANGTSNGVDYANGNFTMLAPNTAPRVVIASPRDGAKLSRNFTIRGTAEDVDGDPLTVSVTIGNGPTRIATGSETWRLDVHNALFERGVVPIRVVASDGRAISDAATSTVVLVAEGEGEDELHTGTSGGSGDIELVVTKPEPGTVLSGDVFYLEGTLTSGAAGHFEIQARIGALTLISSSISTGQFSLEVSTPVISSASQNLTVTVTGGGDQVVVNVPVKGPPGDPQTTVRESDGAKDLEGGDGTRPAPGPEFGALALSVALALSLGRKR